MVKAVFFDKDGVLNKLIVRENKTTAPWTLEELEFVDGSKQAVKIAKDNGFKTFMVTNQPDFGDGSAEINNLIFIIQCNHLYYQFTGLNYCTDRESEFYKPGTGMFTELAHIHDIDLSESYMIGDSWKDIVAGYKCNMKTCYIGNKEDINFWPEEYRNIKPDYFAKNALEACKTMFLRRP